MTGRLRGEPLQALLPVPQANRFRLLTGVDPQALVVDVVGWHKIVLVGDDRVFLFPRSARYAAGVERELQVYAALAERGDIDFVPRVLGRWEDDDVHPWVFASVTRLRGQRPDHRDEH